MNLLQYRNSFGQLIKFGKCNSLTGFIFLGKRSYSDKMSNSSRISTKSMEGILERLKSKTHRTSTQENYLSIWRQFNTFIIRLDKIPPTWEHRISLFGAYLVNNGIQSSTLKCYKSAIKAILRDDGYLIDESKILLNSLAKACKLVNDKVRTRLPIQIKLLELILFEVERFFDSQPYLEILYKSLFILAYYGLFRVGELTTGGHPIRAKDVHIGCNKNKMLFILRTSKTHGVDTRPQKVKISANANYYCKQNTNNRFFCPFKISREYLALRGNYINDSDPFFVFRDQSPVTPKHARVVLKNILKSIDLSENLYNFHSFRIGRATDMVVKFNYPLERVKTAGRWKTNVVYKYIRDCQ